jgi:hypothetical protein
VIIMTNSPSINPVLLSYQILNRLFISEEKGSKKQTNQYFLHLKTSNNLLMIIEKSLAI